MAGKVIKQRTKEQFKRIDDAAWSECERVRLANLGRKDMTQIQKRDAMIAAKHAEFDRVESEVDNGR